MILRVQNNTSSAVAQVQPCGASAAQSGGGHREWLAHPRGLEELAQGDEQPQRSPMAGPGSRVVQHGVSEQHRLHRDTFCLGRVLLLVLICRYSFILPLLCLACIPYSNKQAVALPLLLVRGAADPQPPCPVHHNSDALW